jgi:hypothetical protein
LIGAYTQAKARGYAPEVYKVILAVKRTTPASEE